MTTVQNTAQNSEPASIKIKDFFENIPPSKVSIIGDLAIKYTAYNSTSIILAQPDVEIHCERCEGIRFFETDSKIYLDDENLHGGFIDYVCKNCEKEHKRYSVWAQRDKGKLSGTIYKYGEHPAFGPSTPTRLLRLFDKEKDYFLKGRRCESQGLGIGAFTYYRRIIEAKRTEIFNEVIRVANTIGAPKEMIADLEIAKKEIQFTKGVEAIKHGIPQALLINGHNPLTLLHDALSGGVHDHSDEECLEIATSIRNVLTEFVEKVSTAIKEEKTLSDSVNKLLSLKAKKA